MLYIDMAAKIPPIDKPLVPVRPSQHPAFGMPIAEGHLHQLLSLWAQSAYCMLSLSHMQLHFWTHYYAQCRAWFSHSFDPSVWQVPKEELADPVPYLRLFGGHKPVDFAHVHLVIRLLCASCKHCMRVSVLASQH